jgi:hypothetical protein
MIQVFLFLTGNEQPPHSRAVWPYALGLGIFVLLLIIGSSWLEKRRRQRMRLRFRQFSKSHRMPERNSEQRHQPRLPIPASIEVILNLTDADFFGFSARALDISGGGLAIRPGFPLKRIALHETVRNVLVQTPVNTFVIREARLVRVEHQLRKRLLALSIIVIDADQRQEMDIFIAHLQGFLDAR